MNMRAISIAALLALGLSVVACTKPETESTPAGATPGRAAATATLAPGIPTPAPGATATPARTPLVPGRAAATATPARGLQPPGIAGRTPAAVKPLAPLPAANKLMSLPWEGMSAQHEADAEKSIKESLEDEYIARGTGESYNRTLRVGSNWEFSLRWNNVRAVVDLNEPPGFTSVTSTGFGFAAPRTGEWKFGVAASLAGKAVVETGG